MRCFSHNSVFEKQTSLLKKIWNILLGDISMYKVLRSEPMASVNPVILWFLGYNNQLYGHWSGDNSNISHSVRRPGLFSNYIIREHHSRRRFVCLLCAYQRTVKINIQKNDFFIIWNDLKYCCSVSVKLNSISIKSCFLSLCIVTDIFD